MICVPRENLAQEGSLKSSDEWTIALISRETDLPDGTCTEHDRKRGLAFQDTFDHTDLGFSRKKPREASERVFCTQRRPLVRVASLVDFVAGFLEEAL
jgi:hypothetical protein